MKKQKQLGHDINQQGESLLNINKLETESYFLNFLPQYPLDSNIRNTLGAIKYLQGDIITAKEYFLSALAVDENNQDALWNLKELYRNYATWAECPRNLIDAKTVAAFLEEAFKLNPNDPGIQNDIGLIQLNSGQHAKAEQSLRIAIRLDPTYQEAFYNLGKILMLSERYAEAIDNLIAAINLSPNNEIARKTALEYQKDEIIAEIGQKYKKILIVLEGEIDNVVMLTSALEAIRQTHQFCSITLCSHELTAKLIGTSENIEKVIEKPDDQFYDLVMLTTCSSNFISNFKTWIERNCKQLFVPISLKNKNQSDNLFHIAKCLGCNNVKPAPFQSNPDQYKTTCKRHSEYCGEIAIFLGGTGRSGTTLLTRLLNGHSDLAAFGEVKVLISGINDLMQLLTQPIIHREAGIENFKQKWIIDYFEFFVPWKPKKGNDRRRGLVRWFSKDNILEYLPILDGLKECQTLQSAFKILGSFIQALFKQYAQSQGKCYWAEKTPANAIYAPILAQCFPKIKLVNVIRDGPDVACSLREVGWGTQDPYKALDWWAASLAQALDAQKYLPHDTFLNIRYENLIEKPDLTMSQVVRFLNLHWDENMIVEPVYSQSLGRYAKELDRQAQQYALEKYGKLLSRFRYI